MLLVPAAILDDKPDIVFKSYVGTIQVGKTLIRMVIPLRQFNHTHKCTVYLKCILYALCSVYYVHSTVYQCRNSSSTYIYIHLHNTVYCLVSMYCLLSTVDCLLWTVDCIKSTIQHIYLRVVCVLGCRCKVHFKNQLCKRLVYNISTMNSVQYIYYRVECLLGWSWCTLL